MAALTISSPAIVAAPVTTPTAAALAILLPATADVTAPAVAATVPAAALALAAILAIAPAMSVKIHPPWIAFSLLKSFLERFSIFFDFIFLIEYNSRNIFHESIGKNRFHKNDLNPFEDLNFGELSI